MRDVSASGNGRTTTTNKSDDYKSHMRKVPIHLRRNTGKGHENTEGVDTANESNSAKPKTKKKRAASKSQKSASNPVS